MSTFAELGLTPALLLALANEGYEQPTPIQMQAIPPLLGGADLLGIAQTGTGKTAAFALPILQQLAANRPQATRRPIRALVLAPTRELAAQIDERFGAYGKELDIRHMVIFGGVGQNPQVAALGRGVDVLVATPGRLLDLCEQGFVSLAHVQHFVLDEADRMLDMGFIHDVRRVIKLLPNQRRQNLLFSATMPADIAALAGNLLHNPVRVEVTPPAKTVDRIDQMVAFVDKGNKRRLLSRLLATPDFGRTLVFTRTKHGANRLVEALQDDGYNAAAIHGNKSQSARTAALEGFRAGTVRVLVATDIAARGIDIDEISHVVNFELPNEPESYVHRIGRTARAGRDGIAIAFCDPEEGEYFRDILRVTKADIEVFRDHPYHSDHAESEARSKNGGKAPPIQRQSRGGGGRPHGGGGGGGRRPDSGRRSFGRPA